MDKLSPDEWYEQNRYLREKEVRRYDCKTKVVKHVVFEKTWYVLVSDTGAFLGRVDPKRLWVRQMILNQEEREGQIATLAETDDARGDQGLPT